MSHLTEHHAAHFCTRAGSCPHPAVVGTVWPENEVWCEWIVAGMGSASTPIIGALPSVQRFTPLNKRDTSRQNEIVGPSVAATESGHETRIETDFSHPWGIQRRHFIISYISFEASTEYLSGHTGRHQPETNYSSVPPQLGSRTRFLNITRWFDDVLVK